jgi:N-carbamoyl-L-amino-acid hydrolase
VDLRHPDADRLEAMHAAVRQAADVIAGSHSCKVSEQPVWRIAPIPFDRDLVGRAEAAVAAGGGRRTAMASGALHDAAELARVVPAAMVFAASVDGISHAREERSRDADLTAAIGAFGELTAAALAAPPR